ncbi:TIGR03960 family B12-binding radical SAM protein [Heliobacterium undosum]|uniref:TIGR03960 family B12-binding radical SAM protein n=1 Tax=Heliomicrobium undosum TaxID=121734 RepID=A0A845L1P1_9FIRM|nr:TIGR03960 family B12-binding radical SAM protein [Heliomicrobium undosum]MZP30133.1 TIGR03960 family B12-binding radical SAM protein [Heliomicrobium undosum]
MSRVSDISQILEDELLRKVTKPTRYTGGEHNQVKKDWSGVDVAMAFAFPDVYEVGMSHLGLRILYHLINEQPRMAMERVFAPWPDMEKAMRSRGVPLFSLESRRPLTDFDVVGFTLQYEMSYSNILNMLDLAGIPLFAEERVYGDPLIMAGGPCAVNPEPLAPFMDLILLGEGEELLPRVLQAVADFKGDAGLGAIAGGAAEAGDDPAKGGDRSRREALLLHLAAIPGVYVPALYRSEYAADGRFLGTTPTREGVPAKVKKQIVADLDKAYFPTTSLVPFMDVVHDRVMLEVLRGCSRACRFCQAGSIYRPVRERSPETLKRQAEALVKATGYDEIALTSLSTADYTCVEPLIKELIATHAEQKVGLSLPSLRVDAFSVDLAKEVQKVRKTGLTFAPEAGTQRLRDVINKGVTEADLMETVESAFSNGWTGLKLYFMIGLPTETEEDLEGIARLAEQVVYKGTGILREKGIKKSVRVTVSTSSFVPKAQTPFQWEPQAAMADLEEKQAFLKKRLRDRRISYNWHDARISFLEAVFAKGDRRLGQVLHRAWQKGCVFDGWSEFFRYETWLEAFQECGVDPADYAYRAIGYDDPLPWDHLDFGVDRRYLIREHKNALAAALTRDCRADTCAGCGVCPTLGVSIDLRGGDHVPSPDRL